MHSKVYMHRTHEFTRTTKVYEIKDFIESLRPAPTEMFGLMTRYKPRLLSRLVKKLLFSFFISITTGQDRNRTSVGNMRVNSARPPPAVLAYILIILTAVTGRVLGLAREPFTASGNFTPLLNSQQLTMGYNGFLGLLPHEQIGSYIRRPSK